MTCSLFDRFICITILHSVYALLYISAFISRKVYSQTQNIYSIGLYNILSCKCLFGLACSLFDNKQTTTMNLVAQSLI